MFYASTVASPFDTEARAELRRLVDALRRAVDASVSIDLPADELSSLADRAHALAAALAERSGKKPFARYGGALDPDDPSSILPFSPVSGRYNPLSPPMEFALVGATPVRVVGRITFGHAYEGPPSGVHGGVVASVYDEVLALGAIASNAGGPTATLTVRYRKLTPLLKPLRFEAWTERVEGRRAFVRGACYDGDSLVTEAEAVFARFDPARNPWARSLDIAGSNGGDSSE